MTLSELTNGKYKIILEESWYHERPEVREPDRRWYELIACKGGAFINIYCEPEPNCIMWEAGCPMALPDCREHGKVILRLWTPCPKNARLIWERLKGKPSCHADWLDGEAEVYFPPEVVHLVAKLAGARRKRRLSKKAKEKLRLAGKATQFLPKTHGVQVEETTLI